MARVEQSRGEQSRSGQSRRQFVAASGGLAVAQALAGCDRLTGGSALPSASSKVFTGPALAAGAPALPDPPAPVQRWVNVGEVEVPAHFVGMHAHRWPGGTSPAPTFHYGIARSLNFDLESKGSSKWSSLNPADGVYEWSPLDLWVATHRELGHQMIYSFYGTPTWCSLRPAQKDPYNYPGGSSKPFDLRCVDRFIEALLRRYNADGKRAFRYIEIWNEPEFPGEYWRDSAADLAALGRVVYQAAKRVDPEIIVLGPAIVSWLQPKDRIPAVFPLFTRYHEASDGAGATGGRWMDGLNFHYYATRYDLGEFMNHQDSMLATRAALKRPDWNIHLSEIGFLDQFGPSVPLPDKIAMIRRWIALSAAYGNRFIGLYSYEIDANLGAPVRNPEVGQMIDQMHTTLSGKTIRRAAMLSDGTAWLVMGDGTTLRY